ncbi:YhhN-like protein [Ochromonadaceae sp. CCMP2298]|nr:YhhN-like protein [Ochromonadaceae sp. CCMP2298]
MSNSPSSFFLAAAPLAAAYFTSPSPLTKPLPILALSALSWNNGEYGKLVAAGLALSSVGDVFLELDDSNFDYFLAGLVCFLLAHLLYIAAFARSLSYKRAGPVAAAVLVYYAIMMWVLLPAAETALVAPIAVYGLAISAMLFLALTRFTAPIEKGEQVSHSRLFCLVGSLSFVVSDTILAVDRFALPFRHAKLAVMVTYYIGQTFIAASTYTHTYRASITKR